MAGRVRIANKLHAAAILVAPAIASVFAFRQLLVGETRMVHLVTAAVMYLLTLTGITVGFHRMLAHRAFRAGKWLFGTFAILGSMAAQGPPTYWVSNHRRHHHFADQKYDTHSPYWNSQQPLHGLQGFWHAHAGWTFGDTVTNSAAYARDLLQDKFLGTINRLYFLWVALGLAIPVLIGWCSERSPQGALSGLLWGGGVRLFVSYHATNAINSVAHLWGTRASDTRDNSRNNVLLAWLTLGEGWHNNHHAAPGSAVFARHWWQVDVGGWLILLLEKTGLVTRVRRAAASDQDTEPVILPQEER